MNSFKSFQPLIDRCTAFDEKKHDRTAHSSEVRVGWEGNLIVPADTGSSQMISLAPEALALGNLATRLGPTFWDKGNRVVPAEFYRQMHQDWPEQFAMFTNAMLDKFDGKFLVRGYDNGVRAMLSDQYATLDNAEMLDMASQVLDGLPYEIVESGKYYADNDGVQRDGMAVRVVVKTVKPEDDGPYGLGVLIRNGETGGVASEVRPLVMRTSCLNSLVFRQSADGEQVGLRLTHRGSKVAKANLLASAVAEALPMAADGLERFLTTKRAEIDLSAVIAKLGDDQGWSEELRIGIAAGSEGRQSVFGLINGLTFAAHEMEIDQSARLDLESYASQLVYRPEMALRANPR